MSRLLLIVPVSVLLIFVLLFETFKSVKSATLVLLNVPFAMIGGILALDLTGIHLSVPPPSDSLPCLARRYERSRQWSAISISFQTEGKGRRTRWPRVLKPLTDRAHDLHAGNAGTASNGPVDGIGSEVHGRSPRLIIGGLGSATMLTLIVLPTLYLMVHDAPVVEE